MPGSVVRAPVLVAPADPKCGLCNLLDGAELRAINTRIWDGQTRKPDYHVDARRYLRNRGYRGFGYWSIRRHAEHIEATWHEREAGGVAGEKQVFPTDYVSVTTRASSVGMAALEMLESHIPTMEPRDLVATAKLGVGAAVARQKHEDGGDRPDGGTAMLALFGVVSGHLTAPDGEIKVVTPVGELRNEFEEERRLLVAHAGRGDEESGEST